MCESSETDDTKIPAQPFLADPSPTAGSAGNVGWSTKFELREHVAGPVPRGMSRPNFVPGFHLINSHRLERLRDELTGLIKQQPLPPLLPEVILVQSNGIAQWLKISLASRVHGCGIAAALELVLPARFQWQAYRAVLGNLPEDSPFERSHLVWRLMRLLDRLPDQPVFQSLQRFLQGDVAARKRYPLAQRLAGLYDLYQVYRADWLLLWGQDRDQLIRPDQSMVPIPKEHLWQPALWRLLRDELPSEQQETSRAHVHQRFLSAMQSCGSSADASSDVSVATSSLVASALNRLPQRVLVFGISSLPGQTLEVLAELGRLLPVYVFAHSPSRLLANQVTAKSSDVAELPLRAAAAAIQSVGHPLLTAWGRQGREYLQLLHQSQHRLAPRLSAESIHHFEDNGEADTLLQQLQSEIFGDEDTKAKGRIPKSVDQTDASIVFHVAHSPQREVEVLHDQLLAAFEADRGLQPRDVMVMVPDIHTYAPHIQAVFGQVDPHDPRHLPFVVNDQDRTQFQTMVLAVDRLLRLDDSRLTVSQVIDWLEVPGFRAAAGLEPAELPLLERWIADSGIRWGFNAEHRTQFGVPQDSQQNTWQFGLERLLLGYAMGDGPAWNGIHPCVRVGGMEAATIGKLVRLLDRLQQWWQRLQVTQSPLQWHDWLRQLLRDFFLPQSPEEQSQLSQLESALETWVTHCQDANFVDQLPISVVRQHWLDALREPHLSQRFLGGSINFATLMPMRAIPFKWICLLGMNDADFPRQQPVNEFDLTNQRGQYRPGDRSRGDDDRYLFLEAILSARQTLYISWVGRSIRDNSSRPPSVLVGQLRDHIASGWRLAESPATPVMAGRSFVDRLTTFHPLQPFSRDYFAGMPGLYTFADRWRTAQAASPATPGSGSSADPRRPWQANQSLTLADLGDFLRSPVESFFSQVMQVKMWETSAVDLDNEPFSPSGLDRWNFNTAVLEPVAARLRENSNHELDVLLDAALEQVRGSGSLPHPPFAQWVQQSLRMRLRQQLLDYQHELQSLVSMALPPIRLAVRARNSPGDLLLEDSLNSVFREQASTHKLRRLVLLASDVRVGSRFNFSQWIRLWPQHLALCTLAGAEAETLVLHSGQPPLLLPGLDRDSAERQLVDLLHAFADGMQQPLPVACQTAFISLLDSEASQPSDSGKAAFEYNGGDFLAGDVTRSPLLARCWPTFEELTRPDLSPNFDDTVRRLYAPAVEYLCRFCPTAELGNGL